MRYKKTSIVTTVLLSLCITGVVFAKGHEAEDKEEQSVEYSSLPQAVRTAVEIVLGDVSSIEAKTEVEEGVRWYEIETEQDGQDMSLKLTEAGNLVEIEKARLLLADSKLVIFIHFCVIIVFNLF